MCYLWVFTLKTWHITENVSVALTIYTTNALCVRHRNFRRVNHPQGCEGRGRDDVTEVFVWFPCNGNLDEGERGPAR